VRVFLWSARRASAPCSGFNRRAQRRRLADRLFAVGTVLSARIDELSTNGLENPIPKAQLPPSDKSVAAGR